MQACPEGLHHGFGIAAIAASVPLPMTAAALGRANLQATAMSAYGTRVRHEIKRIDEDYFDQEAL